MVVFVIVVAGVVLLAVGFIADRQHERHHSDREGLGLKEMRSLDDDKERRKEIAKRRWNK